MSATCNEVSLCSVCLKSAGCVLRATATRPVFECDEFVTLRAEVVEQFAEPSRRQGDAAVLLEGLCGNCQNRTHCFVRAVVDPVWQCEEYC